VSSFWPEGPPTAPERASYADALVRPYWLDRLPARDPAPPLTGVEDADLCVVGGGFTGLWAAMRAKADDPGRDVVLLEAETIGFGASGRNGGLVLSSLTHGIANGLARFRDEMPALERLGAENFAGMQADLERHGIACDLELTGDLVAILEPYQDAWLEEDAALLRRFGHDVEILDAAAMQAEVLSPTYRGGLWDRTGAGLLDPGRLADGLHPAAQRLGVRIHERTRAGAGATRSRGARATAARCARGGSCSRRARSRRCCARSAATSRRSTTTSSSPSR
jgi:glycine/D-amino acid oxidase-like deaminating enzyme